VDNVLIVDHSSPQKLTARCPFLFLYLVCHELGHYLGINDLYDTNNDGSGIGSHGLMANSWGFDSSQNYPPPPSAWAMKQLNFATPSIPYKGVNTILRADLTPSMGQANYYIIGNGQFGFPPGEYLLLQYTKFMKYDFSNAQGLIVLHIDDSAPYDTQGYPGQSGWPGNGKHYKIAVLQADGQYQLEKGWGRGDPGDFFKQGDKIGPNGINTKSGGVQSHPNTNSYKGGNIQNTGVTITVLTQPSGDTLDFAVTGRDDFPVAPTPTESPSTSPTAGATSSPSESPTASPTLSPSASHSAGLTETRSAPPTYAGSAHSSISAQPTNASTAFPTTSPTASSSSSPTISPTTSPQTETYTPAPSSNPPVSFIPTVTPTTSPSDSPTAEPSFSPSILPTRIISAHPSASPTAVTSSIPSAALELLLFEDFEGPDFQLSTMSDLSAMSAVASTVSRTAVQDNADKKETAFVCEGACQLFDLPRVCKGQSCLGVSPASNVNEVSAFVLAIEVDKLVGIRSLDISYNIRSNVRSKRESINIECSFDGGATFEMIDKLRRNSLPRKTWTEFTTQLDSSTLFSPDGSQGQKSNDGLEDAEAPENVPSEPTADSDSVIIVRFVSKARKIFYIDNIKVIGHRGA
jgi:hypothetical protein